MRLATRRAREDDRVETRTVVVGHAGDPVSLAVGLRHGEAEARQLEEVLVERRLAPGREPSSSPSCSSRKPVSPKSGRTAAPRAIRAPRTDRPGRARPASRRPPSALAHTRPRAAAARAGGWRLATRYAGSGLRTARTPSWKSARSQKPKERMARSGWTMANAPAAVAISRRPVIRPHMPSPLRRTSITAGSVAADSPRARSCGGRSPAASSSAAASVAA